MSSLGLSSDTSGVLHTTKFIEDVPMIMSVEIGRTDMLIRDILALKKGSVIEFMKVVDVRPALLVAWAWRRRGCRRRRSSCRSAA